MSEALQQWMMIIRETPMVVDRWCYPCAGVTAHESAVHGEEETLTCKDCGASNVYKVT